MQRLCQCVRVLVFSLICMQLAQLAERPDRDAKSVIQEVSRARRAAALPAKVSVRDEVGGEQLLIICIN